MYFIAASLKHEILNHNRVVLIDALKALSIQTVTVEYNGGGDSGDVSDATTEPEDRVAALKVTKVTVADTAYNHQAEGDARYSRVDKETILREAIENFVWDWVYLEHPGWENNDGGRGVVTFFVNEGRLELEHYEFYTESSHHVHELA